MVIVFAELVSSLLDSLFFSFQIWVQPELPQKLASVFYKLRLVNLFRVPEGCDLTWTMFILEAAPFLKELRMTVCCYLTLHFHTAASTCT